MREEYGGENLQEKVQRETQNVCVSVRKTGGGKRQTYGGRNTAGVTARWDEIKAECTSK